MAGTPAHPDAPKGLREKRGFQERFWTAQRVAWGLFAALILAALSGLTGNGGPLAQRSAGDAGGGYFDYPVIGRAEGRDMLVATLPAADGEASLFLSRRFLDLYTVMHLQPLPLRAEDGAAGSTLHFSAVAGERVTVRIELEARRPGLHRVAVGSRADSRVDFTVLVLP